PLVAVIALASFAGLLVSARSLQLGRPVPVIAVTSVAANVITIAAGPVVFSEPLPGSTLGLIARLAAFALVVSAAALTPAPVRARSTGQKASRAAAGGARHARGSRTSAKEGSTTVPAPSQGNRRPTHHGGAGSLPPATKGAGAFGPVSSGRTSCRSVVHIGDSTSEGLDSPSYLPK